MRIYTFIVGIFGGFVKLFGVETGGNLLERGIDWGPISAEGYLTSRG
jgi:hypothetical protein